MKKILAVLMATSALALLVGGGVALAATINCPNATGGYCYGTSVGDAMYGTPNVDRMYGFGGADLIYGYGSADIMYGGNETGWGDRMLGGGGADQINGQGGDDGLYGNNGNDTINGGAGDDIVQGDFGSDTLTTGTGADRVNAQDGQQDFITCEDPANDLVYYDRGLDVLQGCSGSLVELPPPDKIFEESGKVLVDEKGKEVCLPEAVLDGHLKHGGEIINAQGCSDAEQGRS
jgi:hypothetical protein